MSEAIRHRVRQMFPAHATCWPNEFEIYDFVLSEIARAQREGQSEVTILDRILRLLELQEQHRTETERHIMIAIEKLKASSDALTAAVTVAIALPSSTTPDAAVLAFQSDVDAQTSRLLAAEGPTPAPAPAPAPGA